MVDTEARLGYRPLFRVPGMRRLAATMLSARLAGGAWQLTLVLFVLQTYRSPVLAGLAVFAGWMPGLVLAPLAGALLDRYGRVRLVLLDYAVALVTTALLGSLALAGALPAWLMLLIAAAGALTLPLGMSGARTLLPLIVPRHLWEAANAVDSGTANLASIAGPGAAGLLVAGLGGARALIVVGGAFLVAGVLCWGLREPPAHHRPPGRLLAESWQGIRYLFRNPVLRGLTLSIPLLNMADGMVYVALPVLVLARSGSQAAVGAMYAAYGAGGLLTGVVAGRFSTEGRERRIMAACTAATLVAVAGMAAFHSVWAGFAGMCLAGLSVGPYDVAMFSLRQRATRAAWLGRALTMSMSFNSVGLPVGSAVAGPLTRVSPVLGLAVAAAVTALTFALTLIAIPAPGRGEEAA